MLLVRGRGALVAAIGNLGAESDQTHPLRSALVSADHTYSLVMIAVHQVSLLRSQKKKREHVTARDRGNKRFFRVHVCRVRPGRRHDRGRGRSRDRHAAIEGPGVLAGIFSGKEFGVGSVPNDGGFMFGHKTSGVWRSLVVSVPTWEVVIFDAAHGFSEIFPVEILKRSEAVHEPPENRMGLANAKADRALFENPENIFNERALVGGFDSDFIEFINLDGEAVAKGALDDKSPILQMIIGAKGCGQGSQWPEEQPFGEPGIELL